MKTKWAEMEYDTQRSYYGVVDQLDGRIRHGSLEPPSPFCCRVWSNAKVAPLG